MKLKLFATAGIILAFIFQARSQGYIVPNGVTYFGPNIFGGYEIRVLQNPTNSDYTGFMLKPEGMTPPTVFTNTFSFDGFADEGVRVFLVSENQPISQHALQSGSYTELMFQNSYVFEHNSPWYVGLYTGYAPVNGIYSDPLFGWARLVNNQGVIQLLDSALAYQAGGIYVGTQNLIPVPEPSSLALVILGGAVLGLRRRKRTPP